MKQLIIGRGQIGIALHKVLRLPAWDIIEEQKAIGDSFDVLHICFPFSKRFVDYVKDYIEVYYPNLVIIHSTVPIGTTEKCGNICVHSPIRGIHPNLEEGIRTFVKYFGGNKANEAAMIFVELGIKVQITSSSRSIEALKLWDTTQYAWNIILEKEIKRYCDKHKLDFDLIYTNANKSYNEGYRDLGMKYVNRPILKHIKGQIGGHCIISNCKLFKNWITKLILKRNEKYNV